MSSASMAARLFHWSYDLVGGDPLALIFVGIAGVMSFTYISMGFLYTCIDVYHRPQLIYNMKIQKKDFNVSGNAYNPSFVRVLVQLLLINIPLVMPAMAVCTWYVSQWTQQHYNMGIVFSREIPENWQLETLKLVGCALCIEVGFFYGHYACHYFPFLYRNIHKKHHEFKVPIAISATYAHPIEVFFVDMLPLMIGPILFSSHISFFMLYMMLVIQVTMFHHCGYDIPLHYNPFNPADTNPGFHDYHHEKTHVNYGLLGILDRLHGTDAQWRAHLRAKAEATHKQKKTN